ncbi:MAG: DUF3108 domain-containing protein [Planctomycetota bacterium]
MLSPVLGGEIQAEPGALKVPIDTPRDRRPGQAAEQAELAPASLGLQVHERLVYDIRVNGVPAGKSLLEVLRVEGEEKGPQVWVVELYTRSNRAVSWFFYDVDDRGYSKIDMKGGFSRFYSMRKEEGAINTNERMLLTYDIGSMEAVYERPRPDGQRRAYRIPLTGKVLDPLAAIYYLRARALNLASLQPGAMVYLPICADGRVWNTALKVKSLVPTDAGYLKQRPCVVFEPEAEFRGLFERKSSMLIWVDVATGIPLKMAVEIPIGPAEITLQEAKRSPLPEK